MKKRFIFSILCCALIVMLSGCTLLTGTDQSVNYIYSDATVIAMENTISQVYEKVSPSCVGIYCKISGGSTSGSGVVYKEDSGVFYVITNEHVVSGATECKIYTGSTKYYTATIIGTDSKNDLAVLTFSSDLFGSTVKPLDITSTEYAVTVGDTAIAIGCPLGLTYFNVCTTGNISKVFADRIQHDAQINPGNSGGGLFNSAGGLIGINSSKLTTVDENGEAVPVEGMGFAIPMRTVLSVVNDIEEKKTTIERPKLGITIQTINRYISDTTYLEYLPDTLEQGVMVMEMENGISAAKAGGMKVYDVLKSINGVSINNNDDLAAEFSLCLKGETITMEVYRIVNRNFQIVTLTIQLW